MSKILEIILNSLAKAYIRKYKPKIVAVTGNVGKTSTKEAIGTVLAQHLKIRVGAGNLNNQLGTPLTILGEWGDRYYRDGPSLGFWLVVLWRGFMGLIKKLKYPEILILEYGADRPGDIRNLSRKYRPHVAVVTEISKIPVHVEYFDSPEAVAKEKGRIVECLSVADYAILNKDDDWVWLMKDRTQAQVLTFGFDSRADVRISDFSSWTENGEPKGIKFNLNQDNKLVGFKISGSLGKSQALASAAATTVGLIFGVSLESARAALERHHGPKGRLRILKGIKNSWLIDDTYNASPSSTRLALETLRDLPARSAGGPGQGKIAVLGDMLELGEYTEPAHLEIGEQAANIVHTLVCVGPRSESIAKAARKKLPENHVFTFPNSELAKHKVQELIQAGDLVLVKGSQGMRMERIVEEVMAEPEKKGELLVRQSLAWLKK